MSDSHPLRRIISGGQTGVDRGALDAALAAGFPCGGWCPAGRRAEDGPIPARYPLQELPSASYDARTRRNVLESDGTLVIHFGGMSGGTRKTADLCRLHAKPLLVLDALGRDAEALAQAALEFIRSRGIAVLNVAGPRESGHAGSRALSEQVIARVLATYSK